LTHSFSSFDLHPALVQTVAELGYTQPTPIQTALIPVMLGGHDVIGQAQTGTGKTAAFTLPLLSRLDVGTGAVQALVLVPTRELATQVASAVYTYGRTLNVQVLPIFGGQAYSRQIKRLKRGVDVVVATPGRLLDLLNQNAVDLGSVQTVVLDEADEMLSMGFSEDLAAILERTPSERQTVCMSATLPSGIKRLASRYMRDPQSCEVGGSGARTADAIEQRVYTVRGHDKTAALVRLVEAEDAEQALVFARTRASTVRIADQLAAQGYAAEAINGEMTQNARDAVLDKFRSGRLQILVGTDVAARGLDIDDLGLVVNYDLPRDPEVYVHRVGRTGRAGKSGLAVSFAAPNQRRDVQRIEAYSKQKMTGADLPTVEDVQARREERFAARLAEHLDGPTSGDARDRALVTALVAAGRDPMDVAAAAIAFVRAETEAPALADVRDVDFSNRSHHKGSQNGRKDRGPRPQPSTSSHEDGMIRLALDAGKSRNVRPGQVVSALARTANVPGKAIGKISVQHRQTFVDVPQQYVDQVLAHDVGYRFGKHVVGVEIA
jgi:ATP-dependent RNA helicase DeaD